MRITTQTAVSVAFEELQLSRENMFSPYVDHFSTDQCLEKFESSEEPPETIIAAAALLWAAAKDSAKKDPLTSLLTSKVGSSGAEAGHNWKLYVVRDLPATINRQPKDRPEDYEIKVHMPPIHPNPNTLGFAFTKESSKHYPSEVLASKVVDTYVWIVPNDRRSGIATRVLNDIENRASAQNLGNLTMPFLIESDNAGAAYLINRFADQRGR